MPRRPLAVAAQAGVLLLIAMALAACGIVTSVTTPRQWTVAGQGVDGSETVIQVTDTSSRVRDVAFEPGDANAGAGVAVVPGQPDKLDVPWVGGTCDRFTAIDIAAAGTGLAITVRIEPDARPCDAMGVQRVIRLTLDQPIPAGLVVVRQEPGA